MFIATLFTITKIWSQATNFLKISGQMLFSRSYILHLSDCVFMMNLMCFSIPCIFSKLKVKGDITIRYKFGKKIVLRENRYFLLHVMYRMSGLFTIKWCYWINFVQHTFPP